MDGHRFVSNMLPELPNTNRSLQSIFEDLPILSLDEAVKSILSLLPGVQEYVSIAKEKCTRDFSLLNLDESAAIYLYTMPKGIFSQLNSALRNPDRQLPRAWLPFLKLLITALQKLPDTKADVWRGVNYDATLHFIDDEVYTWWGITSCSKLVHIADKFISESGTLFLFGNVHGKDISKFSAFSEENEVVLMPGTRVLVKSKSIRSLSRVFVIHLEEIYPQNRPNQIFERIKQEYRRNGRIKRLMNPAITVPIEQCYINLSIVESKEQRAKEKQLQQAQNTTSVINAYEDIYAAKTPIDVKDIFKKCTYQQKQVLVFGRAGIGKSTFSRYVAYQWAIGSYWSEYELLALIPLRRLTADYYPPSKHYSLIDLVKTELYSLGLNPEKEEELIKRFDPEKTLWILDGYDEIAQNIPHHLERILEQLLKTPHHIITSRPYRNTLSYQVQMEIIGFIDENVHEYVHNFFDQIKDESTDSLLNIQTLLRFLRSNASIWGVAHVPVNLELICSIWSSQQWLETEPLTVTRLYTAMTEWLCRRHLASRSTEGQGIFINMVNQCCQKEMKFFETLAFRAMQNNTILIRPELLRKISKETKICLENDNEILNMGIIKSVDKEGIGTAQPTDKDHYFLHLSFQEYFAARYLKKVLQTTKAEEAIAFIQQHKYNQRFTSLFSFTSGLLNENDTKSYFDLFWDTLLGSPMDLIGIRHLQIVIACMDQTHNTAMFHRYRLLLDSIASCLQSTFILHNWSMQNHLFRSLLKAQSIVSDGAFTTLFINYFQDNDVPIISRVLSFLAELNINSPNKALTAVIISNFNNYNEQIRSQVCYALGKMGEKAATNEVATQLVSALEDRSEKVRSSACDALGNIGEKAATSEVISLLVSALGDQSNWVRRSACDTLGKIGEKIATTEVISQLVSALKDQSEYIRSNACSALGKIGEKTATSEVITQLVTVLGDPSEHVRSNAYSALGKISEKDADSKVISQLVGALKDHSEEVRSRVCQALGKIGEKAVTSEVISELVITLGDQSKMVRKDACDALGKIGQKDSNSEVMSQLVSALGDHSEDVRSGVWQALGKIGEKAATSEVITQLVTALGDQSTEVRSSASNALGNISDKGANREVIIRLLNALGDHSEEVRSGVWQALGKIGEKAATSEVISQLVSALEDESDWVRSSACDALRNIGEKAATSEVISQLVSAVSDPSDWVRSSACHALGSIGEQAATSEVISQLVSAVSDPCDWVRSNACSALGNIGEKAATIEMISLLVSALEDQSTEVRSSACNAVGNIGEKAATSEMISLLVSALEDQSAEVRSSACNALGNIGEKVAGSEMIIRLLNALRDHSEEVKIGVCQVLGKIGEKAATSEVISQLVSALEDQSDLVRSSACDALGNIGEKAATSEVISELIIALEDQSVVVRSSACNALGNIGEKAVSTLMVRKVIYAVAQNQLLFDEGWNIVKICFSSRKLLGQLHPYFVKEAIWSFHGLYGFENVSERNVISILCETEHLNWLDALMELALSNGTAIVDMKEKLMVIGKDESYVLPTENREFVERLRNALRRQAKPWRLGVNICVENRSRLCVLL